MCWVIDRIGGGWSGHQLTLQLRKQILMVSPSPNDLREIMKLEYHI